MNSSNAVRITPRLIVGLGVLAIGLLWTLDNMNILESEAITRWWPVIVIAVGAARLLDPQVGKAPSVVLITIGTLLLLNKAGVLHFRVRDLIPLAIATLGAKLVWDSVRRRDPAAHVVGESASVIHTFALMAGVRRQVISDAFRGGDASAIMGGVELDLRNAKVAEGQEVVIDAFAWWGGVEIKVPAGWRITGDVLPLMGSFEDKTSSQGATGPVLIVRGVAVMGAIEVKN